MLIELFVSTTASRRYKDIKNNFSFFLHYKYILQLTNLLSYHLNFVSIFQYNFFHIDSYLLFIAGKCKLCNSFGYQINVSNTPTYQSITK